MHRSDRGIGGCVSFLSVVVVQSLSCVWLCNPKNCSLPGSSAHGISQARILEWVAISFFGGSSWPGIEPMSPASSALTGCFIITEPFGNPQSKIYNSINQFHPYFLHHLQICWLIPVDVIFKTLRSSFVIWRWSSNFKWYRAKHFKVKFKFILHLTLSPCALCKHCSLTKPTAHHFTCILSFLLLLCHSFAQADFSF